MTIRRLSELFVGGSKKLDLPIYESGTVRTALSGEAFVALEDRETRVLHCCPHLAGGGAEQQLGYLARHWAEQGRDVHIACLKGTCVPDHLRRPGIFIHELPHSSNLDPVLILRLVSLIRRLKPDIVQTWLLQMDVLGGIAAAIARVPWIMREPVGAEFWTGPGIREVYRFARLRTAAREWIARRADAVVSNSAGGDEYWSKYLPASRRFIIENAVPLEEIASQLRLEANDRRTLDQGPLIFAAGRLEYQKNFSVLLEAFKRVSGRVPGNLLIAGEGSQRKSLESLLSDLQISGKVSMPGHLPSIWPTLKSAALFVSISKFEGRPNTVLEAMACGCPLVLSDIPAHREIADESSAILVKNYEDPESVASAINKVFSAPNEARERARLARENVARFSIPQTAAAYDSLYATILSRTKRRARRGR